MELAPGARLGPYEIVAPIGAGGMGEVYRARDSRLGRDVAIKVSAAQFTERFEREARAVAALNHPHICTIHDIGPNYLVMEYIEGQPPGAPQPIGDAVRYATQIADALDAAHAKGIVHRDIKPANVMITARGEAKVLDFGLAQFNAKIGEADASTMLVLTAAGAAVGTVAYMSPEQARGQAVDGRTDVWALGVMLYEMVTGSRPFQGATQASIFDAILNNAVALPSRLNPDVSPGLEQVILKATEKDRTLRYQSAAEMLADLRRVQRDTLTAPAPITNQPGVRSTGGSASQPIARPAGTRSPYLIAAGAIALAVAAGIFLLRPTQKPSRGRPVWEQITNFTDAASDPALSPDGRMLAFKRGGTWFMDRGQIYVKMLPDGQAIQLTRDDRAKMAPAFSPNGSTVAYTAADDGWATWEVPVLAGGEPHRMLANAEGLQWIDPRHILFSEIKESPLMSIETSQESRTDVRDVYVPPNRGGMAHFSALSPDHKELLIVEMYKDWLPCRVVPFDGSSKGKQVGPAPAGCTAAAWSPDGEWMYFTADTGQGGHLWRQRREGGAPEQISNGPTREQGIAMAPDGRSLITAAGTSHISIWIHDGDGDRQISSEGDTGAPYFSPDGTTVFYLGYSTENRAGGAELWAANLKSGRAERVLPGVAIAAYAISPDEKAIAYSTAEGPGGAGGLWYATLDQRTPPRNLLRSGVLTVAGIGKSGDIFYVGRDGQNYHSYRIASDGTGSRQIAGNLARAPGAFSVSPDEQWIISQRIESGFMILSAIPLNGGRAVDLCRNCFVAWSPGGKSLAVTLRSISGVGGVTGVIPLHGKNMLPVLPAEGIHSPGDLKKIPGIQVLPYEEASLGPAGSYAYTKEETLTNLYRIPLP